MRSSIITKTFVAIGVAVSMLALLPAAQVSPASADVAKAGPLRVGWGMTDLTPDLPVHQAA